MKQYLVIRYIIADHFSLIKLLLYYLEKLLKQCNQIGLFLIISEDKYQSSNKFSSCIGLISFNGSNKSFIINFTTVHKHTFPHTAMTSSRRLQIKIFIAYLKLLLLLLANPRGNL